MASIAAVARSLGLDPAPDPARFISEVTRFANNIPFERRTLAASLAMHDGGGEEKGANSAPPSDAVGRVPVPLTTQVWGEAVFGRRLQPSELVSAIISDREAALLCHGLAGMDDETLQYLVDHPSVISYIYQRGAAPFAAFGPSVHIRAGRVVTPGGEKAVAVWESAVGEDVTRPDRFIRQLFTKAEGRLAYLYDGIAGLDSPRAAFALGTWMPSAPARWRRFNALIALTRGTNRAWKINVLPFSRPVYDVVSLLMRVQVAPDGSALPPASRGLWSRVLESDDLPPAGARFPAESNDAPVDAAWLANGLLAGELKERGDRLDQFSFGQRVFGSSREGDRAEVITALRAFERYRMLVLTLDRLGVSRPAAYVAAARHANRLSAIDRRRGSTALSQFQSTLALVAHMRMVRAIDLPKTEALIDSLTAVPIAEDGYRGALLEWIDRELGPLADASSVESGLLARLAAVGADAGRIDLEWEGDHYHLDLPAAENRRLRQIREKQRGLSLDLALDLAAVARRASTSAEASRDRAPDLAVLDAALATLAAWSRANFGVSNAGADPSPEWRATIARVVEDLRRSDAAADARRLARTVEPLIPVADAIGADALISIAYAIDLGDPEGTVLNAGNVAHRHDFGQDLDNAGGRVRQAWSIPQQNVAPGVPWHVVGSALGLDVALAPLGLRRVATTGMTEAPRLTTNERQTFATSVALMNPYVMTDAARDAVAAAIDRGAGRVQALTAASLDGLAGEIRMDGWRRRAVAWDLDHDPGAVPSMFSLAELLQLGGGDSLAGTDQWGMAAVVSTGCVCTRLGPPGEWWMLAGRPQLGLLSTAVPDVQLRVAVALRDLKLPAAIAKDVLSAAVQDYIDGVRPNDTDDWLTLVRTARAIPIEQIEDYVAAVTADGPLMPDAPAGAPIR